MEQNLQEEKERQTRFIDDEAPIPEPTSIHNAFANVSNACIAMLHKVIDFFGDKADEALENMQKTIQSITDCIEKEVSSLDPKDAKRLKEITQKLRDSLWEQDTESFDKALVWSYTKQSLIFRTVNSLLRNNKFDEKPHFIPYIYYFMNSMGALSKPTPENIETLKKKASKDGRLRLYRGFNLPKDSLSFYDPKKVKYFTWNAFTSTTLDKAKTGNFLKNSTSDNPKVLFQIEVDLYDKTKLVPAFLYSAFPHEGEIILPPGKTFEIKDVKKIDDTYYIDLKMIQEADVHISTESRELLAKRGLEELEKSITRKIGRVRVMNVTNTTVRKTRDLLNGKDFIKKLVIIDTHFTPTTMRELMETLSGLQNLEGLIIEDQCKFLTPQNAEIFANQLPNTLITNLAMSITEPYFPLCIFEKIASENSFNNLISLSVCFAYENQPEFEASSSAMLSIMPKTTISELALIGYDPQKCSFKAEILDNLAATKVKKLVLARCSINDEGVNILCQSIQKSQVTSLLICDCSLTASGIKILITQALSMSSLETFGFGGNFFKGMVDDDTLRYIASELPKSAIKALAISGIEARKENIMKLTSAISDMHDLVYIGLNNITDKECEIPVKKRENYEDLRKSLLKTGDKSKRVVEWKYSEEFMASIVNVYFPFFAHQYLDLWYLSQISI